MEESASPGPAVRDGDPEPEDEAYLGGQLITCLGNKRALLDFIGSGLDRVRGRLGGRRLRIFDAFSGSGVVSRYFKRFASSLHVNDLERYAEVASRCYLANRSELDLAGLAAVHADLGARLAEGRLEPGIVARLYAPADDGDIKPGERAFYTGRNARYIDTARRLMEDYDPRHLPFLLAPLLSEASIHANTSGVFKGFHKNRATGLGEFGGRRGDALSRIKGEIRLPFPLFSRHECELSVRRGDANEIADLVPEVDLAYLDPPYNQHPYGSNYFMLNLIADYEEPGELSPVSGIPSDWRRSAYNSARRAAAALDELVGRLKAPFLLVSFNSEGFIGRGEMLAMLGKVGRVEVLETRYNAFRGSRNLGGRSAHVTEYLFLVERR